jgi:hypothetical protein
LALGRSRESSPLRNNGRLSPPPPYEMYDQQPQSRPTTVSQQYSYGRGEYGVPQDLHEQPGGETYWPTTTTLRPPTGRQTGRYVNGWQSQSRLAPVPVEQPFTLPARPTSSRRNDCPIARGMNQGAALCDNIAARFGELFGEHDEPPTERQDELEYEELESIALALSMAGDAQDARDIEDTGKEGRLSSRQKSTPVAPTPRSGPGLINFGKTWTYANSRLPPYQYPFKAYFETWRIICMAARASSQVYQRPRSGQREHYIDASWRDGTKAMVLKSSPVDDKNVIVFAIRGSQKNFVDWAVNFRPAPTAPVGFLDDEGNACHAGFLAVARAMIKPVAERLRELLEQNPCRCASSLLITGHSAGGAVASLLYSHMLSTAVESDLTYLTGCFKRVHCVTFGAPPVSLLPLQKPKRMHGDKSIFLAIANEGDPIVRADREYLISLAKLLASPSCGSSSGATKTLAKKVSRVALAGGKLSKGRAPSWPVPPATLSNAGRVVVLRDKPGSEKTPAIEAVMTTDEQLRDVVFGDPAMHMMTLYRQRVEKLGFAAMIGDDVG